VREISPVDDSETSPAPMTPTWVELHPFSMLANPEAQSRTATVRCRLLFVEPFPGGVTLDVVTAPGAAPGSGAPLTLDVSLPWSKWRIVALAVLMRWADDGREITLEFVGSGDSAKVRVSDGLTWTLLDVRSPSEV
jgi:hypothetical protein